MNENVAQSLKNYRAGYTCSQAVICAYADKIGVDKELAYKMFEGFGGGFGGMQEVCGALSAALAVVSFHCSDGKLAGGRTKLDTYAKIREASKKFEQEFHSIICRDVLNGGKPQPFKCGKKVRIAAEIVDEFLKTMEGEKKDELDELIER